MLYHNCEIRLVLFPVRGYITPISLTSLGSTSCTWTSCDTFETGHFFTNLTTEQTPNRFINPPVSVHRFLKSKSLNSKSWALVRPTNGAFMMLLALHLCDRVSEPSRVITVFYYNSYLCLGPCCSLFKNYYFTDIFLR